MVWYGAVRCGMVWYGMVQCDGPVGVGPMAKHVPGGVVDEAVDVGPVLHGELPRGGRLPAHTSLSSAQQLTPLNFPGMSSHYTEQGLIHHKMQEAILDFKIHTSRNRSGAAHGCTNSRRGSVSYE